MIVVTFCCCAWVRVVEILSSYQLGCHQAAFQTEDDKAVGVENCGVVLCNGRCCMRTSILCGVINVECSECLQRQIANVVQVRSEVASKWCNEEQVWMDGSVYMS